MLHLTPGHLADDKNQPRKSLNRWSCQGSSGDVADSGLDFVGDLHKRIAMARVPVLDVVHVLTPPTKKVKTEEEGEIHHKFAERLDLLKLWPGKRG